MLDLHGPLKNTMGDLIINGTTRLINGDLFIQNGGLGILTSTLGGFDTCILGSTAIQATVTNPLVLMRAIHSSERLQFHYDGSNAIWQVVDLPLNTAGNLAWRVNTLGGSTAAFFWQETGGINVMRLSVDPGGTNLLQLFGDMIMSGPGRLSVAGRVNLGTGNLAPASLGPPFGAGPPVQVLTNFASGAFPFVPFTPVGPMPTGSGLAVWGDLYVAGFVGHSSGVFLVPFSDERIKTDIRAYAPSDALDTVMQLQPRVYKYTQGWQDQMGASAEDTHGFITQELEQIIPDAVGHMPAFNVSGDVFTDFGTLDTHKIVVELVGAVQALLARVQTLEAQHP